MALYERLSQAVPDGALVSFSALYGATALAAPTVLEVGVAPWAGKIVAATLVINTAVVGGDTAVALKIDGGTAIDTLQTGAAGTKGVTDTYVAAAGGDAIAAGEVITAVSDGTATAGDVTITVVMQKGS